MKNLTSTFIALASLLLANQAIADTETQDKSQTDATPIYDTNFQAEDWGLAIGMRRGDIPFATETRDVYDVLPLIRYRNDYLFINGMEGGVHLWKNNNHQVNLYSRFRFVDIPQELQNETQAQAFDFGLQYRFIESQWEADAAFMSDADKRSYGYIRGQYHLEAGDFHLIPYAELHWKSSEYNDYYYGLDQYPLDGGSEISAGIKARYHVASNLYLIGQFGVGRLEDQIANLPIIESQYQYESFLGFGFFPEPGKYNSSGKRNDKKPSDDSEFFRVAHGWATPSDISEILSWSAKNDEYNNQMTSLFYGTRLTETMFSLPIELYFTPGIAWHHDSAVQGNIAEGVIAIKAFYTFELGPRWRLGVAEGLSYVSEATYIEGSELINKELEQSKLLNYLDFSLDMNVGDLINNHNYKNLWFGYSLHHRSGIFGQSSAFGRVSGGSNYQSLYLQWHF